MVQTLPYFSTQTPAYISRLSDAHERSGMSLREVAQATDLDPTYVYFILRCARRPQRDVVIALEFTYRLERVEVDEILLLAGLPPLGHSALMEFRQQGQKDQVLRNPSRTSPNRQGQ